MCVLFFCETYFFKNLSKAIIIILRIKYFLLFLFRISLNKYYLFCDKALFNNFAANC